MFKGLSSLLPVSGNFTGLPWLLKHGWWFIHFIHQFPQHLWIHLTRSHGPLQFQVPWMILNLTFSYMWCWPYDAIFLYDLSLWLGTPSSGYTVISYGVHILEYILEGRKSVRDTHAQNDITSCLWLHIFVTPCSIKGLYLQEMPDVLKVRTVCAH